MEAGLCLSEDKKHGDHMSTQPRSAHASVVKISRADWPHTRGGFSQESLLFTKCSFRDYTLP